MHPHLITTSFLISMFIIFVLIQAPRCVCSIDERFRTCSDQLLRCGNLTDIGYPFWGENRPEYCGYPGFNLRCQENALRLTIQSTTFRVLGIDNTTQTLTVAREDIWNGTCPTDLHNATLGYSHFNYTSNTQQLVLYYECATYSGENLEQFGPFSCVEKLTNYTNYEGEIIYFRRTIYAPYLGTNNITMPTCFDVVVVQIFQSAAEDLTSSPPSISIGAALDGGFGLLWQANDAACSPCLQSSGRCGHNLSSNSFTCYCADQPYPLVCNGARSKTDRTQSRTGGRNTKWWKWLAIAVGGALVIILLCYLILRRVMKEKKKRKILIELGVPTKYKDNKKGQELQVFNFQSIVVATNNFSQANKLGEGGFGPVYKGNFPDGQVVAIKRLSKSSGQGLVEFKNEILLIVKLKHNNLVRLLGCCIEGEEKLLIYEYMPNQSLDSFLFEPSKKSSLDWKKRIAIIEGIAQALLYLHKHSRLRIIHRDLKAGNILLDEKMNPKISDFGLARIFGENESAANTKRVVGTYGYMSPEYAMEGIFSIKSDVFSFGVLLIEIVSGKKNHSCYDSEHPINLIEYAWELWRENRGLELIDTTLDNSYQSNEVLRCIHVGLLCVQDNPVDRPTMPDVVFMLTKETTTLSTPKQPAFFIGKNVQEADTSQGMAKICSFNNVSISEMEAR